MRNPRAGRRRVLAVSVLLVASTGSTLVAATAASAAQEVCSVTVHDHTPDVFPGGLHVHNTCVE